ncbi:MAG: hypothetical protein EHM55_16900, partial [Acidobacteria bacterium]
MRGLLDDLTAKVEAGERLSDGEIAALGSSRDIIMLGMLATIVRRKLHGTEVTYVRVAELTEPGLSAATAPGEFRVTQTPHTLVACIEVVEQVRDLAGTTPF